MRKVLTSVRCPGPTSGNRNHGRTESVSRRRMSIAELMVAAAVAGAICVFALRHDLEGALEGYRVARAPAPALEYSMADVKVNGWLSARDIDECGQVVGRAHGPNGDWQATVWSGDRPTLIDLPGCCDGRAVGFAGGGSIVCNGHPADSPRSLKSYIWREPGPGADNRSGDRGDVLRRYKRQPPR